MVLEDSAVYVRNAYKHYGPKSGPKHKQVLDGLNMTVHRGSIYGLLGASGCGKTTLLSCIVGRRRFVSGELWVLGGSPGTEGSGVPGPRVGFMPQEIALVHEFSVKGVISYFGKIVGMSDTQIENRWKDLSELLDLPPENRRVADCSGGQQRRVSLAAALVHGPELVILDEPTAGVDPVLREKIWEYLVEITNTKNTSIIITTHYIEECKKAHKIGLMRGGKLMAEESPADLIVRFQAETLEEVFLSLSVRQNEGKLSIEDCATVPQITVESGSVQSLGSEVSLTGKTGSTDLLAECSTKKRRRKASPYSVNPDRLKALFYKNWYQTFHNYSGVAFMFLFPLIHMVVFFLAIGADVHSIPLAFVNAENGSCPNFDITKSLVFNNDTDADDCEFTQMSCRFIEEVEDPMIDKIFYTNLTRALADVEKGTVIGVVYFAANFSIATIERLQDGRFASDFALDNSEIKVWLDMSNRQIGPPIQGKLMEKYVNFTKAMLRECSKNPKMGEIPIRFNDAIYGDNDYTYTIFMTPGMSLTVIYFLAAMMTSTIIINDRLEGVWDRTLVAGATTMEVLTAHVTLQSLMIAIQAFQMIVLNYAIFQTDYKGSIVDIFGLLVTQGWAGMCYGFLISALCPTHTMANFMATGSFYPMLMISGVVWPVEGMPEVLEFVSRLMPFTMPIEALRSIMAKGWTITDWQILHAYGITAAWIIFYLLFTFYLLKKKML